MESRADFARSGGAPGEDCRPVAARKRASKSGSDRILGFVGSDEARLKEAALEKFRQLVPPEEADFGAEVVDGAADNADAAVTAIRSAIGALQTLPFFGGNKVVWLKGATCFADSQTGKAQSVLDAAEALADILEEGLPEGVVFLLSAPAIDKRRAFYKRLGKAGKVEVFDRADMGRDGWQGQVAQLVRSRARQRGLDFDPDALELFVMLAGDDAAQIDNELEKLDLFLTGGSRTVDTEMVRRQVALTRAGVVFELGNCISRRDLAGALESIDHLIYRGESAIGILLAAVVPTVRRLLIARELADRHGVAGGRNFKAFEAEVARLPAEVTAHLPRKKDGSISCYPIFLAGSEMRGFGGAELRAGLGECLNANRALVTSSLEPRLVLERLVVRLIARAA